MTKIIPLATYKRMERDVSDQAAKVADLRRGGLAKIAARRNTITREDAVGAYAEARWWLRELRARLAAVTPGDKYCHLSPAAQKRMQNRDAYR